MKTNLLSRVRKHYCSEVLSRDANRSLQRKWVRSLRFLGNRWLLAQPMEKRNDRA